MIMSDSDLDKVAVMKDLIETVTEACKQNIVSSDEAQRHIAMYLSEIEQILKTHGM